MHVRFFLRLLAVIASACALILLIGTLLPRDYRLTAEFEFAAPPDVIFPHVNNLRAWQAWSSYSPEINPQLELTLGPIEEGIDASQSWVETRGSGKLWITESVPNQRVTYDVDFARFPRMTSTIELIPTPAGTLVKWSSAGRLPNGPFYGWFGRYFPEILRADYQASLQRLRKIVEQPEGGEPNK